MRRRLSSLVLALAPALVACAGAGDGTGPEVRSTEPPPRPDACVAVAAGEPLEAKLDAVPEGTTLCLEPGRYRGPIHVGRRVAIWGPRDAVIETSGVGTTVLVTADGASLAGVTVDGSGGRFDQQDAAVAVKEADGVRVEGVRVVNAVFGILSEKTNRTVIRHNHVEGDPTSPHGMRGDGIRLWETREAIVEGNLVRHSRDMVVWYSPNNRFANNRIEHSRYGTHFMYSGGNVVTDSVYLGNAVGIFVMYSRDIRLEGNDLLDSQGPSGMGLGLKESGNITAVDNRFVHDSVGVYIDTSPLVIGDHDTFERNTFQLCDRAVVFHGRADENELRANAFLSNREQVVVEGGGDALAATFAGNRYDDYQGYDLDGDGVGDVPYEIRSLSGQLTSSHPNLAFFAGTPAIGIVEAIGELVPLFAPQTIMVDPRPRLEGGGASRAEGS